MKGEKGKEGGGRALLSSRGSHKGGDGLSLRSGRTLVRVRGESLSLKVGKRRGKHGLNVPSIFVCGY